MIEVYADIWCPFAHVGLRSAVARRDELGRREVVLWVRAWPLELVDGAPLDPGATAEHVEDLRAASGPGSLRALRSRALPEKLARGARARRGRLPQGRTNRRGREPCAAPRAVRGGGATSRTRRCSRRWRVPTVSATPVTGTWKASTRSGTRASRGGVRGSPHFFCGKADAFCPSLEISEDGEGHLDLRQDMEALEELLAGCFEEPLAGDHA